jgi:LysM repeat protein
VSEPKPQAPPVERPAKATVKKGQTLADFAKEWGTSAAAIMMENNLVSDHVKPGTTLKLPRK